jgi:hypothetical protein
MALGSAGEKRHPYFGKRPLGFRLYAISPCRIFAIKIASNAKMPK